MDEEQPMDENESRWPRRRGFIVTTEALGMLLRHGHQCPVRCLEGIPPDAIIVGSYAELEANCIIVVAEHESFEPCAPWQPTPRFPVTMETLGPWIGLTGVYISTEEGDASEAHGG